MERVLYPLRHLICTFDQLVGLPKLWYAVKGRQEAHEGTGSTCEKRGGRRKESVLSVIRGLYSITRQLPRTGRDCLLPGLA